MSPKVETYTPPNTPTPIGPYNHIANVGQFIVLVVLLESTQDQVSLQAPTFIHKQNKFSNHSELCLNR